MSDHKPQHAVPRDLAEPREFAAPRIGSLPAGLELPPRQNPPNPQHPEIPQTYDPRVSVQLERSSRDLASGHPGAAALEDLARFQPDPRRGAGPQPLPRQPGQTPEANNIEGIPPRETPVTFTEQFASYYAGEVAAFTPEEAQRLADLGVTEGGGTAPPGGEAAPANTALPVVSQAADVLTCTQGEWDGAPTAYAYAWQLDGSPVGTDSATHSVTAAEAGQSATCVVTATNATGSTAAPPSAAVVVTDPGATRGSGHDERRRR
jgi:hypothetical protein